MSSIVCRLSLSSILRDVSFYAQLPSRAGACFRRPEGQILPAVAKKNEFAGLARDGDVGHPEGTDLG